VPEAEEGADRAALLEQRFERAVELLQRLSSVTEEQGEFFEKDGTKVEGEIIRIGRIAAYGVADQAAGALAPAGGGQLKIWKDASGSTARALASGDSPDSLSIFLFESLDSQVDDGEGETALEHVASGGAIAWVIVFLGSFGLLLVAIRAFLLSRAASNTSNLEQSVGTLVQNGKYAEAIDYAKRAKGSAARVVASVLSSLKSGTDEIDDVVSESILSENRRIHRFGAVILVIAAVAPLLGLLGTVTGMISTFDVITKYGTGDPKMLSGGISTALVTTELGLIVAIPTLLLGNLLRGWGDGIEADVERVVLRVVNIHKDARQGDAAAAPGAVES
jgi:biopolymer transport protein ExbB